MICAGWRQNKWAKRCTTTEDPFWGVCVFLMQGAKKKKSCSKTIVSAQRWKSAQVRMANNNYYSEILIQQQQQPVYPLRHCVFFFRKKTHHGERIIPHLWGGVGIHHFVVPIPRNPTLLGQDTSLTWRPGTGRYTQAYCTFWQCATGGIRTS